MSYASPCLGAAPRRSLQEIHADLAEQRLTLLLRQANLKAEAILLDRELDVIERRLEMLVLAVESR